jgi:hypothetical protein
MTTKKMTYKPQSSPDGIPMKRWKDLSFAERQSVIIHVAKDHDGKAVTLNLSSGFADYLLTVKNPMRQVGKRINAELNAADIGALRILLMLEAARDVGRLHLHGVIITMGVPLERVQHVMRKAVGYVPGRRGSRQFKAADIYAPKGWANYIQKDADATRKLIDPVGAAQLCWISRTMNQFARDCYEAYRTGGSEPANINAGLIKT